MKRLNVEIIVGVFMLIGFVCFAWMSVRLGDIGLFEKPSYTVIARFGSVAGLKAGATVNIAGVSIGKVDSVQLDHKTYEAIVKLSIDQDVVLQEDVIMKSRLDPVISRTRHQVARVE